MLTYEEMDPWPNFMLASLRTRAQIPLLVRGTATVQRASAVPALNPRQFQFVEDTLMLH